ncbi:MAG: DNA-J related domain-containing protein [Marinagarivorans sp.]|nr:DNA-J related domain-containing protein [Marinagarivorans sp.]
MQKWLNDFDKTHFYTVLTQWLEAEIVQLPCELEEYALIQGLEKMGVFNGLENYPAGLALFTKHFLTRHGAYFLLPVLQAKNIGVEFELMRLRFYVLADAYHTQHLTFSRDALLADFYGDLTLLETATEASVQALLVDFWQRFSAYQQGDVYFAVLGLKPGAKWPAIQWAYRRLAAEHHPDKGGNAEHFMGIQQAYEALRSLYSPHKTTRVK